MFMFMKISICYMQSFHLGIYLSEDYLLNTTRFALISNFYFIFLRYQFLILYYLLTLST